MHTLTLESGSVRLLREALDIYYETACEDADEGLAVRISDLQTEIDNQTGGERR